MNIFPFVRTLESPVAVLQTFLATLGPTGGLTEKIRLDVEYYDTAV